VSNPLAADLDFILEHTGDVWKELNGQRLFITGGTGFFGCWLLESLCWANDHLNAGIKATVLSRSPEEFEIKAPHLALHPSITWIKGDVKDFNFPDGEFSYVIHAATEGDLQKIKQFPLSQFDTIITGTQHVLDFAASHKTKKMLFTSSGAVYGKQPPDLPNISEEYLGSPDPTIISSGYGEGKRAAEMMSCLYANQFGFETKIARCFAFVGPYLPLDANFAIGNFIRDALNGGPIEIKGDGTPYRSYLYAADLTIWLWTILIKGQNCRPYNVGSDEAISIKELAEIVKNIVRSEININILQPGDRGTSPQRYVPSIERAYQELSIKNWTDLDQSISKMKDYLIQKANK
jgi:nucleoside-diphosphate-sugar epimerase